MKVFHLIQTTVRMAVQRSAISVSSSLSGSYNPTVILCVLEKR